MNDNGLETLTDYQLTHITNILPDDGHTVSETSRKIKMR
jgi:hypothetical protein